MIPDIVVPGELAFGGPGRQDRATGRLATAKSCLAIHWPVKMSVLSSCKPAFSIVLGRGSRRTKKAWIKAAGWTIALLVASSAVSASRAPLAQPVSFPIGVDPPEVACDVIAAAFAACQLWYAEYDGGSVLGGDGASLVHVSEEGSSVLVGGSVWNGGLYGLGLINTGHDSAVLKYDASSGALRWQTTLDWPGIVGLASDDSNAYVLTAGEIVALGLDSGRIEWNVRATGEVLRLIGIDADSIYLLNLYGGLVVSAHDRGTGDLKWASPPLGPTVPNVGASLAAGAILVSFQENPAVLLGLNPRNGEELFRTEFLDDGIFRLTDVLACSSGQEVYVVGHRLGYFVGAFNAVSGAAIWAREYEGPNYPNFPHAYSARARLSPDCALVYVTGTTEGANRLGMGDYDIWTIAVDTNEASLAWSAIYDGPAEPVGHDSGGSLAVSLDGTVVYVSGTSSGLDSADYMTLAYDAPTGDVRRAHRFNSLPLGDDGVASIAVSGEAVFVTGTGAQLPCTNPLPCGQFLTVAYAV